MLEIYVNRVNWNDFEIQGTYYRGFFWNVDIPVLAEYLNHQTWGIFFFHHEDHNFFNKTRLLETSSS